MADAGFIPLSRALPNFCFTNALQKPQRWSLHGKRHSIHDLVHSITMAAKWGQFLRETETETMDAFTSDPTARIYAATLPGGQRVCLLDIRTDDPNFFWCQIVGAFGLVHKNQGTLQTMISWKLNWQVLRNLREIAEITDAWSGCNFSWVKTNYGRFSVSASRIF